MTWRGPALDADQADLAALLDDLTDDLPAAPADGDEVSARVVGLAELGLWTLGTAEETGGGGAAPETALLAWERMGRAWPALAWASVQAHAAIDLLGTRPGHADLVAPLHAGQVAVAVVEASSPRVRLRWEGSRLTGAVDRVDAAGPAPHLIVLGRAGALVIAPSALGATPVTRSGLAGAMSCAVDVDAGWGDSVRPVDADLVVVRRRMALGGAAVAAGIGAAAWDAATGYVSTRHQFGDTLTAIPTVRQSLHEQATRVAGMLHAAFGMARDGTVEAAAGVLRTSCDSAIAVAADALQLHGGYGYLTEYPAERFLRDAVSLRASADVNTLVRLAAAELTGRTDATPDVTDGPEDG